MIEESKNTTDYKEPIAISFTNESVEDIQNKIAEYELSKNLEKKLNVNTMESFAINEIIKPFIELTGAKVQADELKASYTTKRKFNTYTEGMDQIKNDLIVGTYKNDKENFIFQLALNILRKTSNSREYLKYTYTKIFIDEYQDCDKDQHEFFMYIYKQLNIKLVIFGDTMQALYGWRGAVPEKIREIISDSNFNKYELIENFRSEARLVDFSLLLRNNPVISDNISEKGEIYYLENMQFSHYQIIIKLIEKGYLDLDSSLLILIGRNDDIHTTKIKLERKDSYFFYHRPRTIISKCENQALMESIVKYNNNKNYSVFDFLLDVDNKNESEEFRREINTILKEMVAEKQKELSIKRIYELLEYEDSFILEAKRYESSILTLLLSSSDNNEILSDGNHLGKENSILTTYGAKGLGFDQVVIFTKYYYPPSYISNKLNENENYVGITRAKEKMILIGESHQNYFKDLNKIINKNSSGKYNLNDFVKVIKL